MFFVLAMKSGLLLLLGLRQRGGEVMFYIYIEVGSAHLTGAHRGIYASSVKDKYETNWMPNSLVELC